jgi:hypothetical protein
MYQPAFGTKDQLKFSCEEDYYELLGYLAKNDGTTRIVWERNDLQGAWGQEGRIEFYKAPPGALKAELLHTAGNGSLHSRVNCNSYIENIAKDHEFILFGPQDQKKIRNSILPKYHKDFDRGLSL